ncbi:MAG: hypothetical protein LBR60_07575 [Fibrobacter sp.]|jgi:hypothetical protein|nr:hypothetical protein [Fibrobacter sp.]
MLIRKKIILFLALAVGMVFSPSRAEKFDPNGLLGFRYGSNFTWALSGNTPFFWGNWLPQLDGHLDFNWIEPLAGLPYGELLDPKASFLRFQAGIETSPFYGAFSIGIGARPFKFNPQLEVLLKYENVTYWNSNVEMTLKDTSQASGIADSWNADYVLDRLYNHSAVDFIQNFSCLLDFDYYFSKRGFIGISFEITLVDISTEYDGKSYDYQRNIPVFSRDFIFEFSFYSHIPVSESWAAVLHGRQYQTGYSRSNGDYLKESLSYTKVLAGASYSWGNDGDWITLTPGLWFRGKERHYKGAFKEQFLIQLQYQGNFSFPVKSNR